MSVHTLHQHLLSVITADNRSSVNYNFKTSLQSLLGTDSFSFITMKAKKNNRYSIVSIYQLNQSDLSQSFLNKCGNSCMKENQLQKLKINQTATGFLDSPMTIQFKESKHIYLYKSKNLITILITDQINNNNTPSIEVLLTQYHHTIYIFELKTKENTHGEFLQYISEMKPVLDDREETKTTIQRILQIVGTMFNAKAGIMLFDQRDKQLVLQPPSFQASIDSINLYRIQTMQPSNASRVFKTGESYYTNRAIGDPNIVQQFVHLFDVKNLATIPISGKEKRIGVLHLINRIDRKWQERDVRTLYWIGSQIGNIIENANLFQEVVKQRTLAEKAVHQLKRQKEITERQSRTLMKQRQELKKSVTTYNLFSNLILDGKGIQGIIEILANELNCSVVLIDSYKKVLAVQFTSQDSKFDNGLVVGQYIFKYDDWRKITVKHKRKKYGYILFSKHQEPRDNKWSKILIKQSKQSICIELMHKKSVNDIRKKREAKILHQIIQKEIKDQEFILQKALSLGFNLNQNNVILVCEPIESLQQHLEYIHNEQIFHQLDSFLEGKGLKCLLFNKFNQIILMFNTDDVKGNLPLSPFKLAEKLTDHIFKNNYRIGISNIYNEITAYYEAYQEAKKAVKLAYSFNKSVVEISEFSSLEMLIDLDLNTMIKFVQNRLGPLIEYDREHDGELLNTLLAYFESNFVLKDTAEFSHFHINTIRYRIAKIEEILQCSLRDNKILFDLQLALKLYFITNDSLASHKSNRNIR